METLNGFPLEYHEYKENFCLMIMLIIKELKPLLLLTIRVLKLTK